MIPFEPPKEFLDYLKGDSDPDAKGRIIRRYDDTLIPSFRYYLRMADDIGASDKLLCDWTPKAFKLLQVNREEPLLPEVSIKCLGMDAASIAAVGALDLQDTDVVLDLCCAPGCKSIAMSQLCQRVVGIDISHLRLAVAYKLIGQFKAKHKITLLEADSTKFVPSDPTTWQPYVRRKRKKGRLELSRQLPGLFDKVLVDAECTHDGSVVHMLKYGELGIEAFRQEVMNPDRLLGLPALQLKLLTRAFQLLKPGGRLVYSTCSMSRKQNEDIVLRFLESMSEASMLSIPPSDLQTWMDKAGAEPIRIENGTAVQFHPRSGVTNGLFIAVLGKPVVPNAEYKE